MENLERIELRLKKGVSKNGNDYYCLYVVYVNDKYNAVENINSYFLKPTQYSSFEKYFVDLENNDYVVIK